ncbi:MAG: M2 family metallopeptidase [Pseudomonadota bacterium]
MTLRQRITVRLTLLGALTAIAGCATTTQPATDEAPLLSPEQFVQALNDESYELGLESGAAAWVRSTYITSDTAILAAKSQERSAAFHSRSVAAANRYDLSQMDASSARALQKLKLGTSQPAPDSDAARRELAQITTRMEGVYGAGTYCPAEGQCLTLGELSNIMATSRDYDEQLDAWLGWRTVSPAMRDDYARFAELTNAGAQELGFDDLGHMWRSSYDMSPVEFDRESSRLWTQVEPLYEALHCYVRRELSETYGPDKVAVDAPIPAHLLGNMWSQSWSNIYELVEPYPGVPSADVTAALVEQDYTPEQMVRLGEDFFVSLGLPELPDTFYERSQLTKPRDRDVVCHASAWPLEWGEDVRIKMCIEPTFEMLSTIYHELGHIYYFIAYKDQPPLFQDGAHDGFHEGIGDTVTLSLTPSFLADLGLADAADSSEEALINAQMRMALDKLAFLPFGKLIDEWRWRVFSGEIAPENYNAAWWELRTRYQGIAPPVARSEADFDPGAKYHIPANTPYTRYFLAHILQFQFQRALCEAAGNDGPLHDCSIYGSKEAGARLEAMLAAGASQPWQDSLEMVTGTREMDASAMVEYFSPLLGWLETRNEGQQCGW